MKNWTTKQEAHIPYNYVRKVYIYPNLNDWKIIHDVDKF